MGAVRALHGAHWLSALGIRVLPARVLHVPTGRGGLSALGIRASASARVCCMCPLRQEGSAWGFLLACLSFCARALVRALLAACGLSAALQTVWLCGQYMRLLLHSPELSRL